MQIFRPLYDKVMAWSRHPHAERYLSLVSFVESSFFPIPTAVMLAPMVMAERARAWWLATVATMTSVAGGVFGYVIGFFFFEQLGQPILEAYGLQDKFVDMKTWFDQYGIWLIFMAGLTPIPYKLFTITSGVLSLAIVPFVLASLVGRASQFFLVAAFLKYGGEKIEPVLHQWMETIGWTCVVLVVGGLALVQFI